jgi:hypothetical protein
MSSAFIFGLIRSILQGKETPASKTSLSYFILMRLTFSTKDASGMDGSLCGKQIKANSLCKSLSIALLIEAFAVN